MVSKIHVNYTLRADPGKQEAIDRAMALHASKCPVARTINGCVEVTTELELVPE